MGGSTARVQTTEPALEGGVTACGVDQFTLTEEDCAGFSDFLIECADTPSAYALAGSPDGSLDFDFPLCCNIASNAPGTLKTIPSGAFDPNSADAPYIPPAGTGYVDVSWLRAGIERYASQADEDESALGNTYLANSGVTYAGLPTSATPGGKQWGGLVVADDGTITQPASGCTNSRANAMGVGNSLSAMAQQTSSSYVDNGDIRAGVFLMDSIDTQLVPYYIGQFGTVDASEDFACWKMQASAVVAATLEIAKEATVMNDAKKLPIVSTYPCGPSMSAFASNHCTDGGDKETGADLPGVTGNTARVNPRIASVVGGQAIFNIIAAVFADTDASTDVGALTNLNCARNLDAMFEINEGAIIRNYDGTVYVPETETDVVTGDIPGAVSFPTWFVAIGSNDDGLGATGFVVPNGFCYTNACMTEFLKTATANGGSKMGKLIKDPNMANPVTSTSKCGQALGACGAVAGYQTITGNTGLDSDTLFGDGPTVWDGKEWPVPMETYVASTGTGGDGTPDGVPETAAIAAGTAIQPSELTAGDGTADSANIAAFRGPVF